MSASDVVTVHVAGGESVQVVRADLRRASKYFDGMFECMPAVDTLHICAQPGIDSVSLGTAVRFCAVGALADGDVGDVLQVLRAAEYLQVDRCVRACLELVIRRRANADLVRRVMLDGYEDVSRALAGLGVVPSMWVDVPGPSAGTDAGDCVLLATIVESLRLVVLEAMYTSVASRGAAAYGPALGKMTAADLVAIASEVHPKTSPSCDDDLMLMVAQWIADAGPDLDPWVATLVAGLVRVERLSPPLRGVFFALPCVRASHMFRPLTSLVAYCLPPAFAAPVLVFDVDLTEDGLVFRVVRPVAGNEMMWLDTRLHVFDDSVDMAVGDMFADVVVHDPVANRALASTIGGVRATYDAFVYDESGFVVGEERGVVRTRGGMWTGRIFSRAAISVPRVIVHVFLSVEAFR